MPEEKKSSPASFEKSLARLEKIVGEMESGELSLDRMLEHFEEGNQLVKACSSKLDEVEKKIELLVRQGQGTATAPYEKEGKDA